MSFIQLLVSATCRCKGLMKLDRVAAVSRLGYYFSRVRS